MTEREEFINFISEQYDKQKELLKTKQNQYGAIDPLINFRVGSLLTRGDDCDANLFNTALEYMGKHIAHVYVHGIIGNKVDESLKDISVYCMILLFMHKKFKEKN